MYRDKWGIEGAPKEAYSRVTNPERFRVQKMRCGRPTRRAASSTIRTIGEQRWAARYIVDLVKRVTTVSVETMAIVRALPPLEEATQPVHSGSPRAEGVQPNP